MVTTSHAGCFKKILSFQSHTLTNQVHRWCMEVKLPAVLEIMADRQTNQQTRRRPDRQGHRAISLPITGLIINTQFQMQEYLYNQRLPTLPL